MTDIKPNLYGGQKTPSKTTNTEARIGKVGADLPYNSDQLQILGNPRPGSLSFPKTAGQVEVKHGVNAVTHKRHMSDRSSGLQFDLDESSAIVDELTNMTKDRAQLFQATTAFTQATILGGATKTQFTLSAAPGTGLTDKDWVYAEFLTGTLNAYEEERRVLAVDGTKVTLSTPFTRAPVSGTILKRMRLRSQIDGGSDFDQRAFNLKITADNKDVTIVHAKQGTVTQGTPNPGANNAVMSSQIQVGFDAYEGLDDDGASIPIFSESLMIPASEALKG